MNVEVYNLDSLRKLVRNLQDENRKLRELLDKSQKLIEDMRENGIYAIVKEEVMEHFALIDDGLVWHGGMNLLGKEDV